MSQCTTGFVLYLTMGPMSKKALENHVRLYCADHAINISLRTAFTLKVTAICLYNDSALLIVEISERLVEHVMKLPEANNLNLRGPTPPMVIRRPVSYVAMLTSVEKNFNQVIEKKYLYFFRH